ncbi:MAG: hypothetical protein AAGD96_13155 [Chloroflexota bacterium]
MRRVSKKKETNDLTDEEKTAYIWDLTFSVQNISPACGSLFPSAVDRAKETEFLSWMQEVQITEHKQNKTKK